MAEIPVSSLTDDELQALEARGVDLSGGTVPVPQAPAASKAVVGGTQLPTSKPIAAPAPSPDVVARARERLKNADALTGGSTYEEKVGGKVVEKAESLTGAVAPEKKEDPVDEADKANFLVTMLGGGTFRKTYTVFGGRMEVTFQTRTAQQDAECATQAYRDEEFEKVNNLDPSTKQSMRVNRYLDYQFVRSLYSVGIPKQPPRIFNVDETPIVDAKHGIGASKLRAARIDIETEFSQPMRIALRSMHVKYENLVGRLTSEVDNQDFWQAGSAT